MSYCRNISIAVALCCATVGLANSAQADNHPRHRTYYAIPDFVPTLKAGEYVVALRTAEMYDALNTIVAYVTAVEAQRLADIAAARQAELNRIAAYVRSQQRPPAPPRPAAPAPAPRATPAPNGGCCTQEQFARLAQCESGGVNGWRTGLYGIEAGYPIGGLSVAQQQAWVMRIYAAHGPSAWGCSAAFG